ncbi:MAG: KpsF/GutQ family sugar-phosphate isomerase [Candidatus Thiodiazotropha sp. (ex Ctena orbiculata)]|uniref:Arabinose 5-phosphate isomerase n=1 Tax=Candidatus Thiodiazotropha taylori TaxID=2792791 RepID=A0A944M753_9GAMM|nr:KpsF/GutQ family sugar-phosphate isomerase [Candidatus Thiodiazotropha taylori]PUB85401.1 MAG: D-arabinose 5-phosphate isomerase [gamma proteobacterium symbiont of Ctena orbiculata]MBT2987504.1 KpsF/GutQ family sugar-phosphate isomerase [Candidatus Thiodiazotropha taylori]MBT2995240.1 KpsF/GutQ family sugar-phosphate isomerase [Candidatus Thiodiazotropha taylori]MBT2999841.1 KpsF/GutQ family sugar-phosphate isomerase [Candidatus Thiodiazotropha taylori]
MTKPITPAQDEMTRMIDLGRAVIETEADAVSSLIPRLGEAFAQACSYLLHCQGRIVVIGMGKSGHIGNKIAATLASTGSPAFFVHPGEASHGDLGMITPQDVVLALSNSGETGELLVILPLLKRLGAPLIAMTGKPESTLARESEVHIDVSVEKEACPLGLAPTSSTTAALVMGDAMAVALLQARGFTAKDFALSHPGGTLGRRLLLRVGDIMHVERALPYVELDATLHEALEVMSAKGLGMTAVVDGEGKVGGVYTDGDLRRTLNRPIDIHHVKVSEVMTRNCLTVPAEMLAAEALQMMDEKKINGLLVIDADQRLIGAFNMHDLLRAGVM